MTESPEPKPPLPELREQFKQFREECIWLRISHRNYEVLFETDDRTLKLLGAVAAHFFQDVNRVMIEYLMMVASRIMDPAETMGRENLTIPYFDRALGNHALLTDEVKEASSAILSYRAVLKEARNHLLAHLALKAVMDGAALGAQKEDDFENFLRRLQVYLDLVGGALGEGPLSISPGGADGDAISLVMALRRYEKERHKEAE